LLTLNRIVAPPKGYLKEVAALCKGHNVLFIVDEVQCGLGRAGANLCHLRDGVRPDLVVLGKALAGGMPSRHSIFIFGRRLT
jgi:ornithine--oxo-acid transaminase